jgi:hypothetical protein
METGWIAPFMAKMLNAIVLFIILPGLMIPQQNTVPALNTSMQTQSEWIQPWRYATISLGQVVNDGGTPTYYVVGSGIVVAVGGRAYSYRLSAVASG